MTRALVTGASGLLGSHLAERLLAAGISVRAWVRPSSDTTYLQTLPVEIVRAEAADEAALRGAAAGCRWVFHAAAHVNLGSTFGAAEDGCNYQRANVELTEALLRASRAAGVERFLYASSGSVYGFDTPGPIAEDAPLEPVTDYGRSKLQAEELVRRFHGQGLAATILRPGLFYGPRDRYFVPTALRLARLPVLPLIAGGRKALDVMYVGDAAELFWLAAQTEAAAGRVYNAGAGGPVSVRDVLEAFRQLTGRGPRIIAVTPRGMRRCIRLAGPLLARAVPGVEALFTPVGLDVMSRDIYFDVRRAREELGFAPRVTLEAGLAETLAG